MPNGLFFQRFHNVLPGLCDKETSLDPQRWTPDKPLWGHSAFIALYVQEHFGGEIVRAPLGGLKDIEPLGFHYWNRLPGEEDVDFASELLGGKALKLPPAEKVERAEILAVPNATKRYVVFAVRADLELS